MHERLSICMWSWYEAWETKDQHQQNHEQIQIQKKLALSKILSSIQTPEDLDAAYRTQQQETPQHRNSVDNPTTTSATNDKGGNTVISEIELSSKLLRSTSFHQRFYAASVCNHLQRYISSTVL